KGSDERANAFRPGDGAASPDHARQCSKPAPTSCLMLTVLGGLAEFERDWIRTRTSEGRERPKARGVKLGRKPKLTGHQRREAIWRRECRRRAAARDRPQLQRAAQHDIPTDRATGQP